MKVDLLITNANILTLDEDNQVKGSVAVKDGKICGLWKETEPPQAEIDTADAEFINLKGKTLIPGFIDTHNHLLAYGINKQQINCSTPPNSNIDDIVKLIAEKVKTTEKGSWIQGYGYDDTLLEDERHPTKDDLDKVAPDHPVLINHISGHFAVVNSKALELAGVTENTEDPSGGKFGRGEDGQLNGVLYEISAQEYVNRHIPVPTVEEMIQWIGEAAQDYLAQGITTNTDAAIGVFGDTKDLDVHLLAGKNQINPMRATLLVMDHLLHKDAQLGNYTAEELDHEIRERSDGKVRLGGAKLFQDGSLQGLTGALRKPYFKNPDVYGDLIYEQNDYNATVLDFHNRGFRIATHGNGDRAIGSILEGYEHALNETPREDHRHRIEHVQTATPNDLDKMKELGVYGSVFINHVYFWGDRHRDVFLGPERAAHISPLASMKERDMDFALHSDCPVTPISPLFSIWAAVNRLTSSGKVLGEEERIDAISALKSMTINGAKFNFTEDESGSIEVGKLADFAVLDQDPTEIDPLKIKEIKVLRTIIDGKTVFQN